MAFQGRRGSGDHPRSRGVYTPALSGEATAAGSSPLARGLPVRMRIFPSPYGIIPARAGFTRPRTAGRPQRGDHPRSRGVYSQSASSNSEETGSSPLARGLRPNRRCKGPRTGIIPARAGFTPTASRWSCSTRDHPRSRGVYCAEDSQDCDGAGSSPLARGLRAGRPRDARAAGIIPARAGFTRCRSLSESPRSDHPRSRGVYGQPRRRGRPEAGSSPLARGLPSE